MSTDLKIKVRRETIDSFRSKCGEPSSCAIANEIKDIFPHACVSDFIKPFFYIPGRIYDYDRTREYIYIPDEARDFMYAFDNARTIEQRKAIPEIEFTITIPDEVINEIDIEAIRPKLENHPTLQLV